VAAGARDRGCDHHLTRAGSVTVEIAFVAALRRSSAGRAGIGAGVVDVGEDVPGDGDVTFGVPDDRMHALYR
jgi:hypothetical protein